MKEGFFKCIDRMHDIETAGKVRTEWTKFATLGGYKARAKADIKTMAQADPILWWTCHGPKSTTTTLAIRLLSQVSCSSTLEPLLFTFKFQFHFYFSLSIMNFNFNFLILILVI